MLVERQELAESIRVELGHQDRRRRAIARAFARGHGRVERIAGHALAQQFGAHGVRAAPDEQRLRLRERVRDEQRLLVASGCDARTGTMNSTGASRVPWCSHWKNACCALVPGSPHSAPAVGPDSGLPSRATRLPLLFEHELLQIRGKAEQRLRVRDHDALGVAQLRGVPPADESQQHRAGCARTASCGSGGRRSRRRRAARKTGPSRA